ncbi:HAD family hydrolase [Halobacteriaceae archaeon GCM10025711]
MATTERGTGHREQSWAAVFWDIGGVILDLDSVRDSHRYVIATLIDEYDVDATFEEAADRWRRTLGSYFKERDGTAFRPARRVYARVVEDLVGERVPDSEWQALFQEARERHFRTNPNARETIATIAETDLHQGVVSDIDADEGRHILTQFEVCDYLDAVTTSEEVGRTKPDPAMFRTALDRAGVAPERAVMVGDRYSHDMAGAARQGIHTVAYGADDGPAVDYVVDDLAEILDILGVE